MNKAQLIKELYQLLPIDDDSLGQMIENAWKLPSHSAIFEYWTGLLGQSPDALDFITHFTSNSNSNEARVKGKPNRTTRSPEPQAPKSNRNPWNMPTQSPQPKVNNKPRLSKNVNTTVSQLLEKPAPPQSKQSQKRERQRKVDNLKDVEEVLRQLELESSDSKHTVCNCMARIHPLFEIAPNCLNCGKIICVKEGLRSCSFCGASLISAEEKSQIVQLLELEKSELEKSQVSRVEVQPQKKKNKSKVTIQYNAGAGNDFWKKQDKIFEDINKSKENELKEKEQKIKDEQELQEQHEEIQYYENNMSLDPDLVKAKANLENLLGFQANSAERTKIIDNASDFELPTGTNLNMWSSTVEKALQLKKQQRTLRDQEEKEKQRSGRGKKVMNITIGKDGKAVLTEAAVEEEEDPEESAEMRQLENEIQKVKDLKNEQEFNTVWDYKKEAARWKKPKYIGGASSDTEETPVDLKKTERVQLTTSDDLDELITVI